MRDKLKILGDSIGVLETIVRNFKEDEGDGLITYAQLKDMPIGTEVDLKNGVKFKKVLNPRKDVYFITNMNPALSKKKAAEFGQQWHDCIEIVYVFEGHLIELISGKVYKRGDTILFDRFIKHKPASELVSRYGVEFLDPAIKQIDYEY